MIIGLERIIVLHVFYCYSSSFTFQVPLPACVSVGRVWHTMAAHHPTPHQAEVITIGGCPQSLFVDVEPKADVQTSTSDTSVLHLGEGFSL